MVRNHCMIYSLFRLCEPFEEITMKRLVNQNFTVIGSILFNPFLRARKLEDDKITERYSVKHVEYRP